MNFPCIWLLLGLGIAPFMVAAGAEPPGKAKTLLLTAESSGGMTGSTPFSFTPFDAKLPDLVRTNGYTFALTNGHPNLRQFRLGNAEPSGELKPGVYETTPYTCIVIVPGPHPDENTRSTYPAEAPSLHMPTIKPELRFIPRKTQ
jgi:hypothetical protein